MFIFLNFKFVARLELTLSLFTHMSAYVFGVLYQDLVVVVATLYPMYKNFKIKRVLPGVKWNE